jgi:hypothetical protein
MSASRQFVDSFGFSWQALEIVRDMPGAEKPADCWLYFLSRGATRRLRTYPRDWAAMSWADLEDLCAAAEVLGTDASHGRMQAVTESLGTAVR